MTQSKEQTIEYAPSKYLTIETGTLAKQADGAVVVRGDDTWVLVTVVSSKKSDPSKDFLPLTVDYRERFAAGGRFPGGFFKREGRPSEKEALSSRLIDRSIRPLFPEHYCCETQVVCNVISSDSKHDADVLGGVGASLALTLSDIPFEGPMAKVRVGYLENKFIVNPTINELKKSKMDLIVAGTLKSIIMIEGDMSEIDESTVVDAVEHAHESIKKLCDFQIKLQEEIGVSKREITSMEVDNDLNELIEKNLSLPLSQIIKKGLSKKEYRNQKEELKNKISALAEESIKDISQEEQVQKKIYLEKQFKAIEKRELRKMIIHDQRRIDGRGYDDIRDIWCKVAYLPRTHGSAVFTRGETQSLATVTLGNKKNVQLVDTLFYETPKEFMFHYQFPHFCVGEVGPMRGVSRREIGHGHLAERSLSKVLPSYENFQYVIRITSDILESNGSSSMASVCSGCLALMDAGVPIKGVVSGIAMGMIVEDENIVILSDIAGEEDFLGDMDFKTAGTSKGLTGCQMDLKAKGISIKTLRTALEKARLGRLSIMDKMNKVLGRPRKELSQYVPKYITMQVDSNFIGAIIGPSGKVIQGLQRDTGTEIWLDENVEQKKGNITISSLDAKGISEAKTKILHLVGSFKEGDIFNGIVKSVKPYGAFVEFVPGKDGLLHVSEMGHGRINNVENYIKEGEKIKVQLIKKEPNGKFRLSRKIFIKKSSS